MKVPDWMFIIINPVMIFLLQSPVHRLWSNSILLVHFTGRKSGKAYVTPARYVRMDGRIRCYSTKDTQWWKNLRNDAKVRLTVAGAKLAYTTSVMEDSPAEVRQALAHYFSIYPQDAAYHDVRINRDGHPSESDLDRAAQHAVVVEAWPVY